MSLKTYSSLVEQIAVDAEEFAGQMEAAGRQGFSIISDEALRFGSKKSEDYLGIFVVRKTLKYDGTPMLWRCGYARDNMRSHGLGQNSRLAEAGRLGIHASIAFTQMDLDRRPEPQDLAITADSGALSLVTHHTHGKDNSDISASTGEIKPSRYLGATEHYDTKHAIRSVYDTWQRDLDAARQQ